MRQRITQRFPFASVGLLLIFVSVAPTIIGMVRGLSQSGEGENATAGGVGLSFHPAFIACGVIGLLLVVVGIVRVLLRGGRPIA